ncbi:hypothetical protein V498_03459, partial [Pseudogymnoascus sp. VKM F-4517 (FW-2822)]
MAMTVGIVLTEYSKYTACFRHAEWRYRAKAQGTRHYLLATDGYWKSLADDVISGWRSVEKCGGIWRGVGEGGDGVDYPHAFVVGYLVPAGVYPCYSPGSSLFLPTEYKSITNADDVSKDYIRRKYSQKAGFGRTKIRTCDNQAACTVENATSSATGKNRLVPPVEMPNTPPPASMAQNKQITSPLANVDQELPLPPGNRQNVAEQLVQDDSDGEPLARGSDVDVTIAAGRDETLADASPTDNTTTGVQASVERQFSHFPTHNNPSGGSEITWLPSSPFSSRHNDTDTRSGQNGTILRSIHTPRHVTTSNSDCGLDVRESVCSSKSNSSGGWGKLPDDSLLRISQGSPRLLSDELECKIFGFYVTKAGYWLDIGSPSHYFQSYIPKLALVEPLVLAACLACASHVMYLLGIVENCVEEHYNGKVLELLIPLLSSSEEATSSNDALLATTVILRMSEQFLEVGNDAQRHLNGAASIFMDGSTDWSPIESSLAIACFWTHQRETI